MQPISDEDIEKLAKISIDIAFGRLNTYKDIYNRLEQAQLNMSSLLALATECLVTKTGETLEEMNKVVVRR